MTASIDSWHVGVKNLLLMNRARCCPKNARKECSQPAGCPALGGGRAFNDQRSGKGAGQGCSLWLRVTPPTVGGVTAAVVAATTRADEEVPAELAPVAAQASALEMDAASAG